MKKYDKENYQICPECQFEKGHSRGCSKFVEPKNPQKDQQGKWEEEFDKKFESVDIGSGYKMKLPYQEEIKQFIKDLLAQEREQVIKEIEDFKLSDLFKGGDIIRVDCLCAEFQHGVEEALKRILTKLRDRK